ncbi:hypothetical protein [Geodermatophilus sp. TF02-6]|uniref:hypothetical protein n=1 Tax=Geodermatophilus sp. TF02-6 TaxID=2250575 RepID=UPI0011BE8029|nr:hypothetical protein [Geodermatophilus sp. TF02-6]
MTIRWFTDADRRDMRDAAEERAVTDQLEAEHATTGCIPMTAEQARLIDTLDLRPWDRLGDR